MKEKAMSSLKKPVNKNPALTNVLSSLVLPHFLVSHGDNLPMCPVQCWVVLQGDEITDLMSLVCKTMRDLHLLRLESYHWGLHFPFFSCLMEIQTLQSLKDFWDSSSGILYVSAVCVRPPKCTVNQHHPRSTCNYWRRCCKAAMYLLV